MWAQFIAVWFWDVPLKQQATKSGGCIIIVTTVCLVVFAAGGTALQRLMGDESLQRYLNQLDRSLAETTSSGIPGQQQQQQSIEQQAQQRLARITKDIQRRVQRAQTDEASFMLVSPYLLTVVLLLWVCSFNDGRLNGQRFTFFRSVQWWSLPLDDE